MQESSPRNPPRRALVAVLLVVSFVCNVLVLFLPFMRLREGISTEPYTLFRSIGMLWSGGLYVLAVLVVAFSVLFPFAKLAVLAWVTASRSPDDRQRRWLGRVELLGKWSLLDVFLVAIILALTSRQIFVGAEPQYGLSLFIAAILLSMTAGEILSRGLHGEVAQPGVKGTGGGVWLGLSGLALAATLALPFLRIHDWLLRDHSYSILSLVPALWSQGAHVAAALTATFLIVTPLAVWGASAVAWWQHRRGRPGSASLRWVPLAHRWSMLDVFGLALTVFALESEDLMRTEVRWGALALAGTLVLQRLFQAALERAAPSRPAADDQG